MFKNTKLAAFGLTGLAALAMAGGSVQASENSNNTWRNVATVGAIVAGIGIANHNSTETVLGAAGAIYSASRIQPDCNSQPNFWNAKPDRDDRNRDAHDNNNRDRDSRNQNNSRSHNHDRR